MDSINFKINQINISKFKSRPNFVPSLFRISINRPWDRKHSAITLAVRIHTHAMNTNFFSYPKIAFDLCNVTQVRACMRGMWHPKLPPSFHTHKKSDVIDTHLRYAYTSDNLTNNTSRVCVKSGRHSTTIYVLGIETNSSMNYPHSFQQTYKSGTCTSRNRKSSVQFWLVARQ